MEFREINEKELDILLELYKILNAKDYHQLPSREEVEKIWIIIQKSEYFKIFVIEEENKIVSSCTFSLIPNLTRGARPYGIIENVITHPEHRKQGFGTHLLKKTLACMEE
jgi:predicted GNAT family acetyltransferase